MTIEQFAELTDGIRAGCAELSHLDQQWTALRAEFDRIAARVEKQHMANISAGVDLAKLKEASAALTALECSALSTIARLNTLVKEASDD